MARHIHTARAAMFAVTSLRRPIKCPFLMPRTSVRTNKRTDWNRLNILRIYIYNTMFYLPSQVTQMLYMSFIIPHLDYCSVVWHNCGTVLTSRVEQIQSYALRVILENPLGATLKRCADNWDSPPWSVEGSTPLFYKCTGAYVVMPPNI